MNMRQVCGGIAAMALCGIASADIISLESMQSASTSGLGAFDGSVTYTPTGADTGTLVFTLANTTPGSIGGYITGFAFKAQSTDPDITMTLGSESNTSFEEVTNPACNPFGDFDKGAALGGNWLGGGSPLSGIGIGQSATFTFNVSASDAGSLTASSFVRDNPPDDAHGATFDFVVRFRGLTQGGSDKVPGRPTPSPGTLSLLSAAGIVAARRRR